MGIAIKLEFKNRESIVDDMIDFIERKQKVL